MTSRPVSLEFREVVRRYGDRTALDKLSFLVPSGSVCAFVGANGAGKTTSFSIVGSFIRKQGGEVLVDGKALEQYRRGGGVLGLLPQDVQFFEDRTVRRHLILFCGLAGLSAKHTKTEVERVLALVSLTDRADNYVRQLSHGMRVRLGLAQAIIGKPPLVLLDEPTAGLDPLLVAQFREIIASIRGKTTLLISSHDLHELQTLCDYGILIQKGRLQQQGPMSSLVGNSNRIVLTLDAVELPGLLSELESAFPSFKFTNEGGRLVVTFSDEGLSVPAVNAQILPWLLSRKVPIQSVDGTRSLEEVFVTVNKAVP